MSINRTIHTLHHKNSILLSYVYVFEWRNHKPRVFYKILNFMDFVDFNWIFFKWFTSLSSLHLVSASLGRSKQSPPCKN